MKGIFKNWKTTAAAISTIAGYFLAKKGIVLPPEFAEGVLAVGAGVGLLFARDTEKQNEERN